jgi:tRNA (guanine-N7-)-methyltransferase
MRMRKKQNLIPRMERCASVLVTEPEAMKGRWLEGFPACRSLFIELGCGKGRFTAGTGESNPDALLVAVERVPDAMVVGMERVCGLGLENVRFMSKDVSDLPQFFAEKEADRIYINFCDPWPSNRHAKRRLTAPEFLSMYRLILKDGGQIHFKTDNRPLFDWSLRQFDKNGWELSEVTNDLHADGIQGIMTDYEIKFHTQGVKINRCVATVR